MPFYVKKLGTQQFFKTGTTISWVSFSDASHFDSYDAAEKVHCHPYIWDLSEVIELPLPAQESKRSPLIEEIFQRKAQQNRKATSPLGTSPLNPLPVSPTSDTSLVYEMQGGLAEFHLPVITSHVQVFINSAAMPCTLRTSPHGTIVEFGIPTESDDRIVILAF